MFLVLLGTGQVPRQPDGPARLGHQVHALLAGRCAGAVAVGELFMRARRIPLLINASTRLHTQNCVLHFGRHLYVWLHLVQHLWLWRSPGWRERKRRRNASSLFAQPRGLGKSCHVHSSFFICSPGTEWTSPATPRRTTTPAPHCCANWASSASRRGL